jgi:prolyl oligopeptidase
MIDVEKPSPDDWREVIPELEDAIQTFSVIDDKLFVTYLHNVTTQIRIFTLEGKPVGEVPLPANSSGWISGRWNSQEAFLSYSSFALPEKSYRYDASTGEQQLWFDSQVPVDVDSFQTRQVWYRSKDGTQIPMFVVHKKGLELDGRRPVLLTGYGGFNVSVTASFSPIAILWAERDGVFAVPNLRGGGEFGEEWHRAGMLANKQNVFDDFIAAGEWLVANKYTNPERLAIQGASNGGLLVGAALTQRPDLFRAVVCGYPDLDMVRYWRYRENNNPPALLEYGDGSKAEHFQFLRAHSPYERVEAGIEYPAVLLTTGEGDTRVPPQQALKMTAKLQWATASGRPILLRFDPRSGHAGGRPFSQVVEDIATEQAFLLTQLGVE